MKLTALVLFLAIPAFACAQSEMACPMHAEHQQAASAHAAGVDARGDQAMGFSHMKSAHHFRLFPDGGAIEVVANSTDDTATRDAIQAHLAHIAHMFTGGDFQLHMFIHDTVPPGVPVMQSRRSAIAYTFEPIPQGGRVRIVTADPDALKAVHDFLTFQIQDHRTGDPLEVAPAPLTAGNTPPATPASPR